MHFNAEKIVFSLYQRGVLTRKGQNANEMARSGRAIVRDCTDFDEWKMRAIQAETLGRDCGLDHR